MVADGGSNDFDRVQNEVFKVRFVHSAKIPMAFKTSGVIEALAKRGDMGIIIGIIRKHRRQGIVETEHYETKEVCCKRSRSHTIG